MLGFHLLNLFIQKLLNKASRASVQMKKRNLTLAWCSHIIFSFWLISLNDGPLSSLLAGCDGPRRGRLKLRRQLIKSSASAGKCLFFFFFFFFGNNLTTGQDVEINLRRGIRREWCLKGGFSYSKAFKERGSIEADDDCQQIRG